MSATNSSAATTAAQPRSTAKLRVVPTTAASKRTAKSIVPPHGWEMLDLVAQRGLTHSRVAQGLTHGLLRLVSLRLAEAEDFLSRLSNSTEESAPGAYFRQRANTIELRTWVGVLEALAANADGAESEAHAVAKRVGCAARKARGLDGPSKWRS